MREGYTSESREKFFEDGAFESLMPLIHHLAEVDQTEENICDVLSRKEVDEFARKCCKVIAKMFVMINDLRQDVVNLREAQQNVKH